MEKLKAQLAEAYAARQKAEEELERVKTFKGGVIRQLVEEEEQQNVELALERSLKESAEKEVHRLKRVRTWLFSVRLKDSKEIQSQINSIFIFIV